MKHCSVIFTIILFFISLTGCSKPAKIGKYKKYAIRFADAEMVRFPEAWQLDHGKRFEWRNKLNNNQYKIHEKK